MPFVAGQDYRQQAMQERIAEDSDVYTPDFFGDVIPAAFRMENSVGSFVTNWGNSFLAGIQDAEKDYDYRQYIKGYEEYEDAFMFTKNHFEASAIKSKIDQERMDRDTLNSAGLMGVVGQIAAGVIDPINLVPVGRAAKTAFKGGSLLKNGAMVAATGMLGSSASELALQQSQLTRTWGESATNITGAAFLGGVLGFGAYGLGALSRVDISKAGSFVEDRLDLAKSYIFEDVVNKGYEFGNMFKRKPYVDEIKTTSAQETMPGVSPKAEDTSAGSKQMGWEDHWKYQQELADSDKIAGGAFAEKMESIMGKQFKLNPSLRLATSDNAVSRLAGRLLVGNPVVMKANVAGNASEIAAEASTKQYFAPWYKIIDTKGIYETGWKSIKEKHPNIDEGKFRELISKSIRRGGESEFPEISGVAHEIMNTIIDPLGQKAVKSGLLYENELIDRYLHRIYNKNKIMANVDQWKASIKPYLVSVVAQQKSDLMQAEALFKGGDATKLEEIFPEIRGKKGAERDGIVERMVREEIEYMDSGAALIDMQSKVTDTILSTPSESLGFRISVGKRGPLARRTFGIPDLDIEAYLDNDIHKVVERYIKVMSADIELTRVGGDQNLSKILGSHEYRFDGTLLKEGQKGELDLEYDRMAKINTKRIESEYTSKAEQMKKDGTFTDDARRSLYREMETAKGKAVSELMKNKKQDISDIIAIRDMIKGTFYYDRNMNPDGILAQSLRSANVFDYMARLGAVTLSQLTDFARVGMVNGFSRVYGKGFSLGMTPQGRAAFKASAQEARLAGMWEKIASSRALAEANIFDAYNPVSGFEAFQANAQKRFNKYTGLTWVNDTLKQLASVGTQDRMFEALLKGNDTTFLRSLGVSKDLGERILSEYKTHGAKVSGYHLANTDMWTDTEAVEAYRSILMREIDRTVVTPGVGDLPLVFRGVFGKTLFRYMSFNMASMQKTVLGIASGKEAAPMAGIIAMVGIGMSVAAFKRALSGREPYSDKDLVWEGIQSSGLLSVFGNVMDTADGWLGIGVKSVMRDKAPNRYTASEGAGRAIGGAFFSQVKDVGMGVSGSVYALKKTQAPSSDTVSAIRRLIPFQNLWYMRRIFDSIEGIFHGDKK